MDSCARAQETTWWYCANKGGHQALFPFTYHQLRMIEEVNRNFRITLKALEDTRAVIYGAPYCSTRVRADLRIHKCIGCVGRARRAVVFDAGIAREQLGHASEHLRLATHDLTALAERSTYEGDKISLHIALRHIGLRAMPELGILKLFLDDWDRLQGNQ